MKKRKREEEQEEVEESEFMAAPRKKDYQVVVSSSTPCTLPVGEVSMESKYPLLSGTPQVGDIVLYRILSLGM